MPASRRRWAQANQSTNQAWAISLDRAKREDGWSGYYGSAAAAMGNYIHRMLYRRKQLLDEAHEIDLMLHKMDVRGLPER
jgi:hypothetical protein